MSQFASLPFRMIRTGVTTVLTPCVEKQIADAPPPRFLELGFDLEGWITSEVVRRIKDSPEYQRVKAEDEAEVREILNGVPGGARPQGVIEANIRR